MACPLLKILGYTLILDVLPAGGGML